VGTFLLLTRTARAPEPPSPAATLRVAPESHRPLAPLLLPLSREASLRAAVSQVQGLWGPEPLERTSLRTHLDQLRRLDLPVVLEMFHPARRDTCFLALLSLDHGTASVSVG
jgi:hypothetical protein